MSRFVHGWMLSLSVFFLIACIPGCARKNTSDSVMMAETVYPTQGKVLFRGKPLPYARVMFHRVTNLMDGSIPFGVTDANGEFLVTTRRPHDGAPPGELTVAISCTPPKNPNASEPDLGPEVLPKKYQDPEQSGLRVTIKPGKNALEPFDIK